MKLFYVDEYIEVPNNSSDYDFPELCKVIYEKFNEDWQNEKQDIYSAVQIQKKAIAGYAREVAYFKDKIKVYLKLLEAEKSQFPSFYENIESAVYHENWGLSGVSEWFLSKYKESSSAKIIGENIFFLENGKMVLKPQKINAQRRNQLIRALLLLTPEERFDRDFHEVYMLDGTRITVFTEGLTKKGQETIVFRRYVVPEYSFTQQVDRHTIPSDGVTLFESMIKIGYNVVFTGAVRTAKTTFLSTWQSAEDPQLEGVIIETDPEIPLHKLMPKSPIIQIVADKDNLKNVTKNILRSDADYVVVAEARDGVALDIALRVASKGTKRMKMTFHLREPDEFCYDVASEIIKEYGGDIKPVIKKAAKSFDYIFHFVQLKDKTQKRLSGIFELEFDKKIQAINLYQICKYDYKNDDWAFAFHISDDKAEYAKAENEEAFNNFRGMLKILAKNKYVSEEDVLQVYKESGDR